MTTFPLFVYGSLKRHGRYHHRYCAGVTDIKPASIPGRLFQHKAGYPALIVPYQIRLDYKATTDHYADAELANRLNSQACSLPMPPIEATGPHGPWLQIQGELFAIPSPQLNLPAIERLEGFHPGRPSLYLRVLARVWVGHVNEPNRRVMSVWTYIHPNNPSLLRPLASNQWNER